MVPEPTSRQAASAEQALGAASAMSGASLLGCVGEPEASTFGGLDCAIGGVLL
jgi:hypothetical protein